MKAFAIILGIVFALIAADYATRDYHARRVQLDYLCSHRFIAECNCAASDHACVAHCDTLKQQHIAPCREELQPSYYKLEDRYTWALLLGLPLAFAFGWGMVRFIASRRGA